jgi:hypothetical protein
MNRWQKRGEQGLSVFGVLTASVSRESKRDFIRELERGVE